MLQTLVTIDHILTNFIYQLPHPFIIAAFFAFFSLQGVTIIIWIGIFFYLVFVEKTKQRAFVYVFLASLLFAIIFSQLVFKNVIQRSRPFSPTVNNRSDNYPSDYSFPSSHATIAFAAATVLSHYHKKRTVLFFIVAFLIAFSRVYLGYHYVFDIIAGGVLGWAISLSFIFLINRTLNIKKRQPV